MTPAPDNVHPHDIGLPPNLVKSRQKNRSLAYWMLLFTVVAAIPGWILYGMAIRNASKIRQDAPALVIAAYVLIIISSVTLVLGLWYLLLAQVRRIARIAGEDEIEAPPPRPLCGNCGWFYDPPDRFCRHCGKPLAKVE